MSFTPTKVSTGREPGPPGRTVAGRRKLRVWLIAGAGAATVGAVLTCALLWNHVPAPADDTTSVAKFVRTAQFENLPEEQKRPYLDALRTSKAQLAAAHDAGKISDEEYETALQNAWVGRLEKQMDDYFALTDEGKRTRYLDKIINQREAPHTTQGGGKKGHSQMLRERMTAWPPEMRTRWNQFRRAVQERRRLRGLPPDPHMQLAAGPLPR